jgi:hypothetical protein
MDLFNVILWTDSQNDLKQRLYTLALLIIVFHKETCHFEVFILLKHSVDRFCLLNVIHNMYDPI